MTAQLAQRGTANQTRIAGRLPIALYCMNRSIGWWFAPIALAWSLWEAFFSRSRPWEGDWVMALTFTTGGFVFITIVAGCTAAYDAGNAINTEIGAAWDSIPRRLQDIVALWLSAIAPYLLVNIVTTLSVMVTLVADGAAYGQTLAVLAQQWVILGFACALGVLLGVLQGPRAGSLTALVVGAYIIYWQGYVDRSNVPPTRSISATASLIGLKLNEHLVSIQVAQAAIWILVALFVAAFSQRAKGAGARRPTALHLVLAVLIVSTSGWVAGRASINLPDPVPASMPQNCVTDTSTTVCLYKGHDRYINDVLTKVVAVRDAATKNNVANLIPDRVIETKVLNGPTSGQLGYDAVGGAQTSTRSVLSSLLPAPGGCASYAALDALPAGSAEAKFPQVQADAISTVAQMLNDDPVKAWAMQPQQLSQYVDALSRCDIAAAVRID